MNITNIFTIILIRPILTLLVGIYQVLLSLHIPSPLGFSIILLTIIIRFLLYPLISSQLKASKKMQTISPHISKLKEKHKGDAKRLQAETMKLYKEHGVNPAAGCLPVLVQFPIIWALYAVLQKIVSLAPEKVVAYVNSNVYIASFHLQHPWDQHFFGVAIGKTPSHLLSMMPFIILAPLLTGGFQLIQSKMMIAPKGLTPVVKKKDGSSQEDFAAAFQTQSLFIFPLMIGFFSFTLPFGLSLYWNTFTIFGILQQYRIQGIGGLTEWRDTAQKLWHKTTNK